MPLLFSTLADHQPNQFIESVCFCFLWGISNEGFSTSRWKN